ncbi:Rha family transcriptional regulator [Ligilactobacillus agilis]|uniref:Rha family transcriptional regulator n=1 Tax=Ligilactobacillus agilis TaxID=1601 RepID=UPI000B8D314C|nr:Rha family transcriptional regulator [Ligilactobacillus agilis]ASR41927.1 antirepressor [Ligilactobacillus agilis]
MNNLVIMHDQQAVTTSLILAEAFDKQHKHVIEAIEKKISTAENSALLKTMFVEDCYTASNGKQNKMYYLNRDGFTFIAMGFTGRKADEFKLKYIDAFNKMETYIKDNSAKLSTDKRLEIMEENAKTRKANLLYKIAMATKSEFAKESLLANAGEVLTGQKAIPVMRKEEFSATTIGNLLGISANKVGRIANELGLKAEQPGQNEYGRWGIDKASNGKEVPNWVYFKPAIAEIEKYLGR